MALAVFRWTFDCVITPLEAGPRMVVALRNPPLTFPIQVSLPPATASAHRERVAVAWSGRATPVSQCIPFCYGILYCFCVVFDVISGATPVVPLPACVSHPGFALVRYRLSTQGVRGSRLAQARHAGESMQTPFVIISRIVFV